jgi:hypothetical protein
MGPAVAATLSGLICGSLLNIFYKCLKHVWPQNYFGLSGSVDPIVSRNLVRWTVFRFLPPAVAVAAASLTAERYGGPPLLAGVLAAVVHLQRIVRESVSQARRRRWSACVFNGLLSLLLFAVMSAAWFARDFFAPLVPDPHELVSNIWAGFLAAIGAVHLQQIVLLRRKPRDLLVRSFREIPFGLRSYAFAYAVDSHIDPRIPLAIMTAENLERPRWVRRFERLLPRRLSATRGIMQQGGARNDRHSIELAFEKYGPIWKATPGDIWPPVIAFERYNYSEEFQSLALGAFEMLDGNPSLLAPLRRPSRDQEQDPKLDPA